MGVPRRALVAGACLAAGAGVAWLTRDDASSSPDAGARAPPTLALSEPPPPEPSPPKPAAIARVEELQALSETYRGTTFLTAIRSAGFVCYELVSVYGGINDSATWTVNCADMLAYTVRVDAAGRLVVEPTAQYLDGLAPGAPRDGEPPEPRSPLRLPR
jgi:hypothetical protein